MLFERLLQIGLCVGPQAGGPSVGVVLHQGLHPLPIHQWVAVIRAHSRADKEKAVCLEKNAIIAIAFLKDSKIPKNPDSIFFINKIF